MRIVKGNEFNDVVKSGTVLVDFFATWCGPCKMLSPVLEEVSEQFPEVTFVKVDCDEAMEVAEKFAVRSIPAVFLLKDGKPVGQFIGLQSKEKVTEFLKAHL